MPFLRRYSIAFSMSAAHSVSAFLQSETPAPVRSRRSLIICWVMSAMCLLALALGGRGGLGLRHVGAPAGDHLHARSLAARGDADRLRLGVITLVAPLGG